MKVQNLSLTNAYVVNTNSSKRSRNDYYATPPLATECLIDRYGALIEDTIWEPAAGRGWISKTLEEKKYDVYSSDLYSYSDSLVTIDRGVDYLLRDKPREVKSVITNPPYKDNMAQKFVEKTLEHNLSFAAFFLRLTFLESACRHEMFKKNPPAVLIFSERMTCQEDKFYSDKTQISGMVAYAWFVWSYDVKPGTIDWIKPSDVSNKKIKGLF